MKKKKKRLLNKKYHPDYRALFPGVAIPPRILAALRESDRKMEYIEHDLKHSRVRRDTGGEVISVTPPREDSLERMLEANNQFAASAPSPEELFMAAEETIYLYRCLEKLEPEERALIHALYFDGLTEREYAFEIALCQKTVNNHKRRILAKMRKWMGI